MCLLAWNWQPGSPSPLLLIGNRDEFYARPTQELHWWSETQQATDILAGRDLQAGGTWLGVSRSGRVAALTNFRNGLPQRLDVSSRGALVAGFLSGTTDAGQTLAEMLLHVGDFNPFNLLVFDGDQLLGLESRRARIVTFSPGVGGVSNADFQTPWPKLQTLTQTLVTQTLGGTPDTNSLFALLQNTEQAPDHMLPHTGIAMPLERALSPIFVKTPGYGTHCSSVVQVQSRQIEFSEKRFDAQGLCESSQFTFSLPHS